MCVGLVNGDKQCDVRSRLPIARDWIFVSRPIPIAIRSTRGPRMSAHRFRPRLQHQGFPLPIKPDLESKRRLGRYVQPQYLTRKYAGAVGVTPDDLRHYELALDGALALAATIAGKPAVA